jgi:D-3-phosphoglycerate dehydrogenase
MTTAAQPRRVLCAGDRFITADSLAAEATAAFGPATEIIRHASAWPDVPFRVVDGVREAAGDPTELAALASDAHVILTHLAPITAGLFQAAPALQVVGITRGGPVNVDLATATAHGVPVVFLPGRNLGAVAEFVIGAMISLTRSVPAASRGLAAGHWDSKYFRYELTGPELRAATVGLVGLGAVGARVAQLLTGFGARVLAYDPYADPTTVQALGVELVPLAFLLGESDIVSVHARLSEETRKMFDADAFARMRPGARFINTARGELVDQAALLAALDTGHLAGAALDVFDPEPPRASDPLLGRPDVLLTPHLAGASRQVATESVQRVTAEVAAFLDTGVLQHCANPDWQARSRHRS